MEHSTTDDYHMDHYNANRSDPCWRYILNLEFILLIAWAAFSCKAVFFYVIVPKTSVMLFLLHPFHFLYNKCIKVSLKEHKDGKGISFKGLFQ